MITPVMHTFPSSPVHPAYEALAVQHGFNFYPVVVFEGRRCYAFNSFRCFGGKGRGYHNKVQVKFLDTEEIAAYPSAEFSKKAKNP